MGFTAIKEALAKQQERIDASRSGVLIPLINTYLSEREQGERRPGFHPSQIAWNFCPRLYALLELGWVIGVKDVPPRLARIFDNGHGMHDRWHKYVMEAGLVLKDSQLGNPKRDYYCQEMRVDHPVGLTGNLDDILDIGDYWYVTDYKSMNPRTFEETAAFKPVGYHVKQLVIYLGLVEYKLEQLGREPEKPLKGLLLYEQKSDMSLKEYVVDYGERERNSFQKLLTMLEGINEAAVTADLSTAPCTCGDHLDEKWEFKDESTRGKVRVKL